MTVEQMKPSLWEKLEERKPSTPRIQRLRDRCRWKYFVGGEYVDPNTKVGTERMRIVTEAYKETEGMPPCIQRARFMEKSAEEHTIFIQDEELLVSYHAEHPDWVCAYPDGGYTATLSYAEEGLAANEEEFRELLEYWEGKGLEGAVELYLTPEEIPIARQPIVTGEPSPHLALYSSVNIPYQSILEDGMEARVERCENKVKELMERMAVSEKPWKIWDGKKFLRDEGILEKLDEYRAMARTGRACITWVRRYSRLARIIADNLEFDVPDWRREELRKMADICWHVPAKPSRGFWDAMQCKTFLHMWGHSYERFNAGMAHLEDMVLWPYYKKSVLDKDSEQPLTREQCLELIESERLWISQRGIAKGRFARVIQPGANDLHILTIGGCDEEGKDACNEVTKLILEAALNTQTPEPSVGLKWHPNLDPEVKRLTFECIRRGLGFPSIKHDELNTKQLENYFDVPHDEACRWALQLCMSPGRSKRTHTQKTRTDGGGGEINCKCIELALSDGFDYSFMRMQWGPKTGDPTKFRSIEEVWRAFEEQTKFMVRMHQKFKDLTRWAEAKYFPSPFYSICDDWSLETGIDSIADYEVSNPWANTVGNADIIDSFAAMEKLIFIEKKYTMEELIKALRDNWVGHEEMRQDFLDAPKWGNDDDFVDKWGIRWYETMFNIYHENINICGYRQLALPQTVSGYAAVAPMNGAFPSGRKHGEVVADGGNSPYMGMDKKGPTAVLKSLSKADYGKMKGCQFNQRLSHTLMRSEAGYDLWCAYMDAWHECNIDHVQFNVFRAEDLRAAQREPEKWQNLLVRVAGYSVFFVGLPRLHQDTIIARTEQELSK